MRRSYWTGLVMGTAHLVLLVWAHRLHPDVPEGYARLLFASGVCAGIATAHWWGARRFRR